MAKKSMRREWTKDNIRELKTLARQKMHRTDCRDLIGKRLWVVVPQWNSNTVEVSPLPNNWSNTRKLRSGSFW